MLSCLVLPIEVDPNNSTVQDPLFLASWPAANPLDTLTTLNKLHLFRSSSTSSSQQSDNETLAQIVLASLNAVYVVAPSMSDLSTFTELFETAIAHVDTQYTALTNETTNAPRHAILQTLLEGIKNLDSDYWRRKLILPLTRQLEDNTTQAFTSHDQALSSLQSRVECWSAVETLKEFTCCFEVLLMGALVDARGRMQSEIPDGWR